MTEVSEKTKLVRGFYDELNVKCNFKTKVNAYALPPRINQVLDQISEETMKRYYGSGMVIPENVKGARVLDIGCGSGSLVFILSKLVGPTGYVVGIDISEAQIETCKKETAYHVKAWGYDKPNFEFLVANCERLVEMNLGDFDIVVSNGVFCLVPDKQKCFESAAKLLKTGGQFYINDVYTHKKLSESAKNNLTLWSLGVAGSMVWTDLKDVAGQAGFTVPYLTQTAPVEIKKEEYNEIMDHANFVCAAWRLFKLPPGAKRGAATVTYKGNIEDYEEAFPWDVNLTFKKGEPVNVDAELATILAFSSFKDNFDLKDFSGSVTTARYQDPFAQLEQLKQQGKGPEPTYTVEMDQ